MVAGDWVVLGGSGFLGAAVRARLHAEGARVAVVDRERPELRSNETFLPADLHADVPDLGPGHVVLALEPSTPRPVRPWTLVLDHALVTARAARALAGREVILLSSVEVYGDAPGPLTEDTPPCLPVTPEELDAWVDRALLAAAAPVAPHRCVALCRELADRDPSGRWVPAMARLAQEKVLERALSGERLTVLRLAEVIVAGQHGVVGRIVEAVLAGRPCPVPESVRGFVAVEDVARVVAARPGPGVLDVSAGRRTLADVAATVGAALGLTPGLAARPGPRPDPGGDGDGGRLARLVGPLEPVEETVRRYAVAQATDPGPMFRRELRVVVPPRPHRPDVVADRIAECLWSGVLRGGRWSRELTAGLSDRLGLPDGRRLVLTSSGTHALRLALWAAAGAPDPGAVALVPAYTFHATTEVLRQLGWSVRLVDVDPWTWTIDPELVAQELVDPAVGVVVAVDALGDPADYARLRAACAATGTPFVADSAPALGAEYDGTPVGTQADAHAFSMSFAKTMTGAGSGGAVVVPADADLAAAPNWLRSSPMTEPSAVAALDHLEALDDMVRHRDRVAGVYCARLLGRGGFGTQHLRPGDRHAHVHWVVRVPTCVGRDRLAAQLAAEGVQSKPYYEPLAETPDGPLPVTAALHAEALALPMSSELSLDEAERVATAVERSLRRLAVAPALPTTGPPSETA